jgi:phospholipid transport system substrate-binding protein
VKRLLRIGLFAGLVALIPAVASAQQIAAAPAQQAAAQQVVEKFQDQLLGVMKNADSLGLDGRRAKLTPAVEQTFDLKYMAQTSVGPAWETMTPAQRDELVELFRRMTVSTYAARFKGYSGQTWKVEAAQATPQDTIYVRTVLTDPGKDKVAIDYLLRSTDGTWKVADVYLSRISELAVRRSEYSAVVRRDGVDKLLATLEQKVKDVEAGRAS